MSLEWPLVKPKQALQLVVLERQKLLLHSIAPAPPLSSLRFQQLVAVREQPPEPTHFSIFLL